MHTFIGILYAFIWATGAIATKIGLVSSTPLIFAATRLVCAGGILYLFVYLYKKSYPYPRKKEWMNLLVLGVLNTTLYVGCSFMALAYVDSTMFNLLITLNPFFVVFLSSIFLKRKLKKKELLGMVIAAAGLLIALIPYLDSLRTTLVGLLILGTGILSMGIGSVYFQKIQLDLPRVVINTWQIILGSVIALPFVFLLEPDFYIQIDRYFLFGLFWQVVMISILAMLLWFYLLKIDAVKANNFLFLTPVFGYALSAVFLDEPLTLYHYLGALLVVMGTIYSRSDSKEKRKIVVSS
jgi:drug/metabolite transporter (DMT)-like permease